MSSITLPVELARRHKDWLPMLVNPPEDGYDSWERLGRDISSFLFRPDNQGVYSTEVIDFIFTGTRFEILESLDEDSSKTEFIQSIANNNGFSNLAFFVWMLKNCSHKWVNMLIAGDYEYAREQFFLISSNHYTRGLFGEKDLMEAIIDVLANPSEPQNIDETNKIILWFLWLLADDLTVPENSYDSHIDTGKYLMYFAGRFLDMLVEKEYLTPDLALEIISQREAKIKAEANDEYILFLSEIFFTYIRDNVADWGPEIPIEWVSSLL